MATAIIPHFDKSIKFDRETRDFCVQVNGECIGYASTYTMGEAMADSYVYEQLQHAQSAPLQQVASTLAQAAHEAGDTRSERALNKAALALVNGVTPVEVLPGEYLISSGTRDVIIHRYTFTRGCSCEAGSKGQPCWHASTVEILAVARGAALAA